MSDFGYGWATPTDGYGDFNQIAFLVRQMIAEISTMTPVKVVAVSNSGGISPVGTVDVQPLVTMLDGNGNATNHGVLPQVPYFRLQGGANAVIIDPVVGDVGYCIFADQDISAVKSSKQIANPGSRRKFDMSDSIYVGGILNDAPTQYVRFTATGVSIADKNGNLIDMGPDGITVTGNLILNGNLQISGTVEAIGGGTYAGNITTSGIITGGTVVGGGKNLATHVHSGVTIGGGNSGPPV